MKDTKEILDLYESAYESGRKMVMATVVDVTGSAYRRPGAHLLVTSDGKKAGSISAGCLENDILARSDELFSLQRCLFLQYENGALFGLNYGCDGTISVLVEPITDAKSNYIGAFKTADTLAKPVIVATVFSCDQEDLIGAKVLLVDGKVLSGQLPAGLHQCIVSTAAEIFHAANQTHEFRELNTKVFFEIVKPALRMVMFGAGDDVIPLLETAQSIGFDTTLVDSRRSYLDRYASSFRTHHFDLQASPSETNVFDFAEQTAVVIMSHNFELDKRFLEFALRKNCAYLGIMGSKKRTLKLLTELNAMDSASRIHFPIGIDIGAETPDEIALSIVSEIMMHFRKASGRSLSKIDGPVHRRNREIDIAILAAGQGSRMGGSKQLAMLEGETLLSRAIRTAKQSGLGRIIVVLGAEAEMISQHVPGDVVSIVNHEWRDGIASSIRKAVEAAGDGSCQALLFMTADQPFVDASLLQTLAATYQTSSNPIVASLYGTPGIPAVFSKEKFPDLLQLKGDRGAKQLIISQKAELVEAPLARFDIDTDKDLHDCRETARQNEMIQPGQGPCNTSLKKDGFKQEEAVSGRQ